MNADAVFMFLCTLLVFFMTPGLAFFYGGMVRRKNALNTMMFCVSMIGIGIFLWVSIGYSLSFSGDNFGMIGDFRKAFLRGVDFSFTSDEMPEIVNVIFQMMFAVISPAIILGSLAERMKFTKMLIFAALWSIFAYYPLVHMAWGGGWMEMIGAVDFAGGNVIHVSTGFSGLIACIMLGKRKGYGSFSYHPHNIPLFLLGASILWVGWFGFNCGCAGGINSITFISLCNTAVSSATGMIVWMIIEMIVQKKCTVMGGVTGGIVGLVGITPGAGYVPVWSSFIIGALAAPICYFAISKIKKKFGYDDALDAFGCHGVGGIWGGIATGIFASGEVNDFIVNDGLIYGETKLFFAQLGAIGIAFGVVLVVTCVLMTILKKFGGLRVTDIEEAQGMDIIEHGEQAYPAFNGMD